MKKRENYGKLDAVGKLRGTGMAGSHFLRVKEFIIWQRYYCKPG